MIERLVTVCILPSLLINWIYLRSKSLEKEKYNFYCGVNKLVYVTPTVRDNCAHAGLLFFNFRSLDFSLLHACF